MATDMAGTQLAGKTAAGSGAPLAGRRGLVPPRRSGEPTLPELGRAILEARWTVLGAVLLCELAALAYLAVAPPTYRASALLQIDDPNNAPARVENLSPLFDPKGVAPPKPPVEGEIQVIRSRTLLHEALANLQLDLVAEPRRVPFLGQAIARLRPGAGPASPLFGLHRFAWGGERIEVSRLDVSEDLLDRPLTLTALGGDRFEVKDEGGARLLEAAVGAAASARVAGHRIELLVGRLEARPGTEFRLERLRSEAVVDRLQEDLNVEERPKDSGVVSIQLEGHDPVRIAQIVSALTTRYLARNLERRSAETERTLEYLQSQLPGAKRAVDAAEAELARFRSRESSVDLALEAKAAADRVAELGKALSDLEAEQSQLRRHYGADHPDLAVLARKIDAVRAQIAAVGPRVQAHPLKEFQAARLAHGVTEATELYALLLKQVQALQVVRSGMIGNVILVDRPVVARRPVRPRPAPALALAFAIGLGGGIVLAMARRALREEVAGDPREIEAAVGLPVLAHVPHSDRQAKASRRGRDGLLAVAAPDDLATEQLRALRTSLGFLLRTRGNVVALSSPSPGAGKSFVAANLAELFAAVGKRVLVVDADLRCGVVHERFGVTAQPGLTDVLLGSATVEESVRPAGSGRLDVLPGGSPVERPAELLAGPRLREVLSALSQRYDVVVLDTPPALAVTDPVLVAGCASVNLLVLRARRHPMREIAFALERLERSGAEVHGAVLNDAEPDGGYVYEHRGDRRRRPAGEPSRST